MMGSGLGRFMRAMAVVSLVLASGGGAQALEFRSWDQHLSAGRFVVLSAFGSQAVLDKETQLVWQRTPASVVAGWSAARSACENLVVGGRRGWRLPAAHELTSLIDPVISIAPPRLPDGHPFVNVATTRYWTTTPSPYNEPGEAFVVDLAFSDVDSLPKEEGLLRRWCVRGGGS